MLRNGESKRLSKMDNLVLLINLIYATRINYMRYFKVEIVLELD